MLHKLYAHISETLMALQPQTHTGYICSYLYLRLFRDKFPVRIQMLTIQYKTHILFTLPDSV